MTKRAPSPMHPVASGERQPHIPLLTEREAAAYCRYFDRGCNKPVQAFQKWARRSGIPVKYAGRSRLYDPRILDAFLDRTGWTHRYRVSRKPYRPHLVSRHGQSLTGGTDVR